MTQYWINFAATGDPNRRADGRKLTHGPICLPFVHCQGGMLLIHVGSLAGTGRSQGLPLWETFGAHSHGTMQFGSNQSFTHRPPHTTPPNVTLDVRTVSGMICSEACLAHSPVCIYQKFLIFMESIWVGVLGSRYAHCCVR